MYSLNDGSSATPVVAGIQSSGTAWKLERQTSERQLALLLLGCHGYLLAAVIVADTQHNHIRRTSFLPFSQHTNTGRVATRIFSLSHYKALSNRMEFSRHKMAALARFGYASRNFTAQFGHQANFVDLPEFSRSFCRLNTIHCGSANFSTTSSVSAKSWRYSL